MKKSWIHFLNAAIVFAALAQLGCATRHALLLPDGTSVEAGPSYRSSGDLLKQGKNLYGVPESTFAFYPPNIVLGEKNPLGYTREKVDLLKKNAVAEGGRIACYGFIPAEAPDWDLSYCDPPSIRHDCFDVERLFVVPWGSGEGELGYSAGNLDVRQPLGVLVGTNGQVAIYDKAKDILLLYDWSGHLLKKTGVSGTYNGIDEVFAKYAPLPSPVYMDLANLHRKGGLHFSFVAGGPQGNWNSAEVMDNDSKIICRLWLPPQFQSDGGPAQKVEADSVSGTSLPNGIVLNVRFEKVGVVIYRYSLK